MSGKSKAKATAESAENAERGIGNFNLLRESDVPASPRSRQRSAISHPEIKGEGESEVKGEGESEVKGEGYRRERRERREAER